jgi:NADH-quinone oxidoreductase subunit N
MTAAITAPYIDWTALGPIWILTAGAIVALAVGLVGGAGFRKVAVPLTTVVTLLIALVWLLSQWADASDGGLTIVSDALRIDTLTVALGSICLVGALFAVLISLRSESGLGSAEFHSLLLFSVTGMLVLIAADDLVTLFLGMELVSIPLYVLSGSAIKKERSLEAGLKYLIVGSVGSATLLYGLALLYGATGATGFSAIAKAAADGSTMHDALFVGGMALAIVGISFKASAAPFHQWTPDVYEGAPTGVTTFMATATKAAALGILIRLLVGPLLPAIDDWSPIIAVLAVVSIAVGNFGALGQDSLKRMLAWSSIAQVGYLLAAVVVAEQLGIRAVVFYLAVYGVMTLAAFAVVADNSRDWDAGERLEGFAGLGSRRPWLAGAMSVAMLALAGLPPTAGFVGKLAVIDAVFEGGYGWLAFAVVIGSLVSLAYYLRVIAVMWFKDAPAEAETAPRRRAPELVAIALVAAAATIAIGVMPSWPLDQAAKVTPKSLQSSTTR